MRKFISQVLDTGPGRWKTGMIVGGVDAAQDWAEGNDPKELETIQLDTMQDVRREQHLFTSYWPALADRLFLKAFRMRCPRASNRNGFWRSSCFGCRTCWSDRRLLE